MSTSRIGSCVIVNDGAAVIVHCPALRAAGPALMLAMFGVGTLFIVSALWSAFNSRSVAVAANGVRVERRWCGILLSTKTVAVETISALDSTREARFAGIFSGARHYRLRARSAAGTVVLADHLQGAAQTEEMTQILLRALARPQLADGARSDHRSDASETAAGA